MENLRKAREVIHEFAFARRYAAGPVRIAGGPAQHYARSAHDGQVTRLNRTAALVARALREGCAMDAVAILAEHHPDAERSRLEEDVLTAARALVARGILVPERAAVSPPPARTRARAAS